ncbi:F0F1-type ATP synthase membrane subunit b/b' [Xanthomonas arboricola]|uniref:lysis system i-spanin subunit Rz n=1 Tax=Xanthomonas cannabis TaxID=1885674 RepID=UPI00161626AA|nr:lysis system i-spanin subunit Rz [Xanthomonas cannabis]MBB3806402.1 F0F1-type ATP synthase membrane subunit b/b' [Xanthomonas cannabis]
MPIQLKLAIAAGLLVLGFWAGWEWRDRSADVAESDQRSGVALGALAGERAARTTEHKQAETLADIGAKHEEDRQAAQAVPDAVVADLRSGVLQLRNDLATCSTDLLSRSVTGAIERDAHAQLRSEVAGAAVQIVRDADDHIGACQAVVLADRIKVAR